MPTDDNCRRRSRAAGQRFADATLVHAQTNVTLVDDFHEANVHALRKLG
jgi:hypothetical protein